MKYLEELNIGESFFFEDQVWFLTSDFKLNGDKLCYNLANGFPKWINSSSIVEVTPIYYMDKDNNITPIKIYEKQNSNIH